MTQYSKLQEKDILEISRKYNLKQISYESIEESAGNSNYLVRTAQNQYVLTIFEIEHIRVANISRLLSLLEEIDFPTTRIQKLANGDVITSYQGKPVMLKPYLVGHVVENMDENMVSQVGEAIANLHEIPSPDYLPGQHAYGLETFPRVMDKGINLEYENWLAQRYDFLMQTLPSGLPRGLIHGDVFSDNVLFDGKKFKALIDFEEACQYYKVFDLGMAVVGLCTEESKVRLPKVRSLINGYQKIRVLEKAEKEFLPLFIEYAAIATSSWRFWKHNIDTPIAELSGKHWEMVNIAIDTRAITNKNFMNAVFS
jgi:homoserine kinase type II